MSLEAETAEVLRHEKSSGPGMVITRGKDGVPHMGRKQRGADEPRWAL